MILLFAGQQYNNYQIALPELGKTQFVVAYAFSPILSQSVSKVQEYVVSGIEIGAPKGGDRDYYLQTVLTRMIEDLQGKVNNYIPDANKLRCPSKISRYYPAFNYLEKTTGLDAKDLKRNVLADVRDSQHFNSVGGALNNAVKNIFITSLSVAHFKSNKEIVRFLLAEQQKKTGWETAKLLDFYNTVKTAKLIVTMNASVIREKLGIKTVYGSFQNVQLEVFKRRNEIESSAWDDTLTTLDAYSEMIGNKDFVANQRWFDLMAKLEGFGIKVS